MTDYPYEIKLENEGGEEYYILRYKAKELENVIGCGKTEEEALKSGKEALDGYLSFMKQKRKRYIVAVAHYIPKGEEFMKEWLYVSHVRKCGIIYLAHDKKEARRFPKKTAEEVANKLCRCYAQVRIYPYMEKGEIK